MRDYTNVSTCYIWSIDLYGADIWTVWKADSKSLQSFEVWSRRRMEKISWTYHAINEEVLQRVKDETIILQTIKRKED
jgi:hypothetical protein